MARLKELLKLAEQQIGYQEKASAAMLDDPHGNAGYNNYTKYARDVNNWGLDGMSGTTLVCDVSVLGWKPGYLE